MIRHVVLFRLREEPDADRDEHVAGMRDRLEALQSLPGVVAIQVDPDVVGGADHWDVALVADFADRAALDAYQTHPDHVAAVAWMADLVVQRSIADVDLR